MSIYNFKALKYTLNKGNIEIISSLRRCSLIFRILKILDGPEVPGGFQEVKVPRLRNNGLGWW
jgi:hypothetical protein